MVTKLEEERKALVAWPLVEELFLGGFPKLDWILYLSAPSQGVVVVGGRGEEGPPHRSVQHAGQVP